MNTEPKTLQEAIIYFSDPVNCREYLVARRWPKGVACPRCGSKDVLFLEKYNRWHCRAKHDAPQFTLKTGTIMEDSPIALDKWLTAMWLIVNCKNGISSYEIHRALGITQKSAWFLDHRIRLALTSGSFEKLTGHVEADETFIGGKARNMHLSKRKRRITGTGTKDKTAVMGMLERGGKVRVAVVPSRRKGVLQQQVRNHIAAGSALYTDALQSYDGLSQDYAHKVIDHAEKYVDGKIHTNGLENFWSLLKRGINGTYISVEPFHLFRYLDEQAYRYNNRKLTDGERFSAAVSGIVGKRVTFDELTGKSESHSSEMLPC
ncbi:MAG TPA: IS1595 family transposase [Candidatus Acidoferrales bacterium]|nr:IS1595 family transposase [Candidatus Acidoferrales bacterium]